MGFQPTVYRLKIKLGFTPGLSGETDKPRA
jgi:hypothetical protein